MRDQAHLVARQDQKQRDRDHARRDPEDRVRATGQHEMEP